MKSDGLPRKTISAAFLDFSTPLAFLDFSTPSAFLDERPFGQEVGIGSHLRDVAFDTGNKASSKCFVICFCESASMFFQWN
jgi:hypothetical protein